MGIYILFFHVFACFFHTSISTKTSLVLNTLLNDFWNKTHHWAGTNFTSSGRIAKKTQPLNRQQCTKKQKAVPLNRILPRSLVNPHSSHEMAIKNHIKPFRKWSAKIISTNKSGVFFRTSAANSHRQAALHGWCTCCWCDPARDSVRLCS